MPTDSYIDAGIRAIRAKVVQSSKSSLSSKVDASRANRGFRAKSRLVEQSRGLSSKVEAFQIASVRALSTKRVLSSTSRLVEQSQALVEQSRACRQSRGLVELVEACRGLSRHSRGLSIKSRLFDKVRGLSIKSRTCRASRSKSRPVSSESRACRAKSEGCLSKVELVEQSGGFVAQSRGLSIKVELVEQSRVLSSKVEASRGRVKPSPF